jgi:hypothetical protein
VRKLSTIAVGVMLAVPAPAAPVAPVDDVRLGDTQSRGWRPGRQARVAFWGKR